MTVERFSYFGGSDAAKVLGKHSFDGPRSVYERIRQGENYESEDLSENRHIKRGNFIEPICFNYIKEQEGSLNSEEVWETFDDGGGHDDQIFLRHPNKHYVGGHPDGISIQPFEGIATIEEIKAPTSSGLKRVKRRGIPDRYRLQLQHYGGIANLLTDLDVHLRVHIWDCDKWKPFTIEVERREDVFQNLLDTYDRFWAFAQEDIPFEETDLGQNQTLDKDIYRSEKMSALLSEYHGVHTEFKRLKERKKDLKSQILSQLDGESRIEGDSHYAKIKEYSNSTHLTVREK